MILKVSIPGRMQFKTRPGFYTLFMQKEGEIHYIGGADILPAPLEAKQEQEMIGRLGGPDEKEARSKLIEHNLRLVVYIAKKFDNTAVGVEDLISIGTIGLIKAINTFNPEKNIKLATYASRCIENEILMYFRNLKKSAGDVYISDPIDTDKDGNALTMMDIISDDEESMVDSLDLKFRSQQLYEYIQKCLSSRERTIIVLRYGLGGQKALTQREVAMIDWQL